MDTIVTLTDVFLYLKVTAAVLLVIVLYNLLFVVVDLRKVLRRIEVITNEIQNIILKPINVADHILEGIVKYIEAQDASSKKEKPKKKKK